MSGPPVVAALGDPLPTCDREVLKLVAASGDPLPAREREVLKNARGLAHLWPIGNCGNDCSNDNGEVRELAVGRLSDYDGVEVDTVYTTAGVSLVHQSCARAAAPYGLVPPSTSVYIQTNSASTAQRPRRGQHDGQGSGSMIGSMLKLFAAGDCSSTCAEDVGEVQSRPFGAAEKKAQMRSLLARLGHSAFATRVEVLDVVRCTILPHEVPVLVDVLQQIRPQRLTLDSTCVNIGALAEALEESLIADLAELEVLRILPVQSSDIYSVAQIMRHCSNLKLCDLSGSPKRSATFRIGKSNLTLEDVKPLRAEFSAQIQI